MKYYGEKALKQNWQEHAGAGWQDYAESVWRKDTEDWTRRSAGNQSGRWQETVVEAVKVRIPCLGQVGKDKLVDTNVVGNRKLGWKEHDNAVLWRGGGGAMWMYEYDI